MVRTATIAASLLGAASVGLAAVASEPASGLRLVKLSDSHEGTWMTERQKFDELIAKRIGFADITDTLSLEARRVARSQQQQQPVRRGQNGTSMYPATAQHQAAAEPLLAQCDQSRLESWAKDMTDMYSRYYKSCWGKRSSDWMYKTAVSAASSHPAIKVEQWEHKAFNQPSIIATLPGSKSDAKVIVSAHFDSISDTPTSRAPGADDNASGAVVVLEALRVLADAAWEPENTLEFHLYAAEEGGLLGSRDVFQAYADQGAEVLAMMNQDMTGFSPNNVIAVFTDFVDPDLTEFLMGLVPVYSSLPLSTDVCGYACSDHGSAMDAGFPAAYVCDENIKDSSPYIHSTEDTYDTLSFPHILEHAKYTVGFLVEGSYF